MFGSQRRPQETADRDILVGWKQEAALHYNYFRDYDASTGRYMQSDPIGLGGGLNTYGYVGGNPLSYVDPQGLVEVGSTSNWMVGGYCQSTLLSNILPPGKW